MKGGMEERRKEESGRRERERENNHNVKEAATNFAFPIMTIPKLTKQEK